MKDFAKSIMVRNASGIKEFNTEADLRRWCIEHQYAYTPTHGGYYRLEDDKQGRNRPDLYAHVKAGNSKVGNATIKFYGETIDLTKESEIYLKEILEELQMMHEQSDAQRAIKEELNKRKTGNSKVGNKMVKYTSKSDSKKEFLYDEETGDLEVWYDGKKVDSMKKAGEGWKKYIETHAIKSGNSKVGNGITVQPVNPSQKPGTKPQDKPGNNPKKPNEKEPEKPFSKYIEEAQKNGNSTEKLFYSLKDDAEKEEEKSDEDLDELKKTGNETYQHKLYPDKYVIIEGKNYKIVTDGKVEKSGELTDAVLYGINQTYKRVGNVSSEYEILKQDPSKMHPMYKKAYEEAMKKLAREDEEFKKRFEKEYGVKAKNEASDDKFAYVMREFDEGKLKTPDGKVVTDPAQAKAIAYSESKKTENGLARARNAIKKNS